MKHHLPDMVLFNAGNAENAVTAGNDESSTEERLFGFPFSAITAFSALTPF